MRTRRVGTMTLGASLIVFGVLFCINLFTGAISLQLVMKLWPLILIGLGIEILISAMVRREEQMRFDMPAILLTCILGAFSMIMACIQLAVDTHMKFVL